MANASFEKAMKLAVVTGLRSMLGPALLAQATGRPDRKNWALAALGELAVDKLPLIPSRDTLLLLLVRGVAGAWVAKTMMKEEGIEEPWAMPLGAAVAMGVAVAAPKIRKTLGWTTGVPDPLLGLLEDYLALRLGTEAVGMSLDEVAQVAKDTVEDLTCRVQAAIPTTQSVGAGSM
jgi:uncharacterized membrane protein